MATFNFVQYPSSMPFRRSKPLVNPYGPKFYPYWSNARHFRARLFAKAASLASTPAPSESSSPRRQDQKLSRQPAKNLHDLERTKSIGNGQIKNFEFLSWQQVESLTRKIAQETTGERFDVVLAITRGGLIPATLLCELFELRTVLSATVIFYTDDGEPFFGMTEPRFLSFPSPSALQGRRVLIVDDVWDSGRTANAVHARVSRVNPASVKVAVLHFKPTQNIFASVMPDFYGEVTDKWVVYPWERMSATAPSCTPDAPPNFGLSTDSTSSSGNSDR